MPKLQTNGAKQKRTTYMILLLWAAVCFALLVVDWCCWAPNRLDADMASEQLLANLLAQEGGVMSTNWYYSTELRVLNTQLVMAPLFRLFTSWHTVRVVGSVVLILLYLAAWFWFGRSAKLKYSGLLGAGLLVLALLVLLACMLPFFMVFEGRKPQARELTVIAVLCALGVAGRAAFFMLPQFKPVLALTIISGVALGGETGFLVGAMTMLASNVLFSQGPWTPFQMFAMGVIGFLAGVLFRKGWLRRSRGALSVFGAIAAVVVYGGIMNPVSALLYARTLEWKVIAAYYITGFPMDCVHAAATVLFLLVLAEPMLEKLSEMIPAISGSFAKKSLRNASSFFI